jgi:hypothetical protein
LEAVVHRGSDEEVGVADKDWLWNEPLGIPEAEDIGPPVGDRDLALWEARHGVALPAVLRRAYRQQDGGYVRGSERGVCLNRLHLIEPVDAEYLVYLGDARPRFDLARLFLLGGDDTGANILLHFGEPGGADPAVYAHYTDGEAVERLADTADGLFGGDPG